MEYYHMIIKQNKKERNDLYGTSTLIGLYGTSPLKVIKYTPLGSSETSQSTDDFVRVTLEIRVCPLVETK